MCAYLDVNVRNIFTLNDQLIMGCSKSRNTSGRWGLVLIGISWGKKYNWDPDNNYNGGSNYKHNRNDMDKKN